ncbi:MAG: hypothetical protein HY698_02295 [Deltaproteobacteria bacterium]|nr:hypothetical protein [Deltaproteobacteria bacterium]
MKRAYFLVAILCSACQFDVTGSSDDRVRPQEKVPDAATADSSMQQACEGEKLATCVDEDTIRHCGSGQVENCSLGCLESERGAHCGVVVPSNGVDPLLLDGASAELVIPSGETWIMDTGVGAIYRCGAEWVRGNGKGILDGIFFQPVSRRRGASLGIFAFRSLSVAGGANLRAVGSHALVLLVDRASIRGTIDVSGGNAACGMRAACGIEEGSRRCGGPGGGWGGDERMAGQGEGAGGGGGESTLVGNEYGGGGGGFGDVGGSGGSPQGGSGGTAYGVERTDPMAGGSGGGGGGLDPSSTSGYGGGGGGALQITAMESLEIFGPGSGIKAGGAGGGPGWDTSAGGGGGSGGAILLESTSLRIEGAIAANGGGGGGGAGLVGSSTAGESGAMSTARARGGTGTHAGGWGGALEATAGSRGSPEENADGTGGGGGAVGRIYLRSTERGIKIEGGALSPKARVGEDLVQ